MTPEEVFAQLRDIHAPASTASDGIAYDYRPILLFAAILLAVFAVRLASRRLSARRALARIDASASASAQRDALIRLAEKRRAGRGAEPPPEAAFQRPDRLSTDGIARLRRWVARRIG